MLRTNITIALAVLLVPLALIAGVAGWAPVAAGDRYAGESGDRYEDERHDDVRGDERHRSRSLQLRPEIAPASHALYVEECAACHMSYPAALLPAASWQRMMGSLEDHFGENAELDAATAEEIEAYLVAQSADRSDAWLARKLQRGTVSKAAPLRISELPYFVHEHEEMPRRLVQDNPQVGSFSRCEACHQDAEQGMFDEHRVNIAGFGPWDD